MWRRIALATVLALLVGIGRASPGLAAGVPAELSVPAAFQGAWYVGPSCSDVDSYLFRGDGWQVAIARGADPGPIVADSSAFSVLEAGPGEIVVSGYWRDPAKDEYVPAKLKLARDGTRIEGSYVSPPAAVSTPKITENECDKPEIAGQPWPLAADYLAGLTSIFGAISTVQNACGGGAHACAAAIIATLDLNHDGKISPAELVSFFRRTSKLGLLIGKRVPGTGILRAEFTLEQVAGAELGASIVGPIVTPIVMGNIDYNGDGFIEEDELETFLNQIGVPAGPGYLANLIESAKGSADQAARSLGALQQLLGAFGAH